MSSFVRVPPQSTGKRVSGRVHVDFPSTPLAVATGSVIYFNNDVSKKGTLTNHDGDHSTVVLYHDSPDLILEAGDTIHFEGTQIGIVSGPSTDYYQQGVVIAGQNPYQIAHVDKAGALVTRDVSGSQTFNSAGLAMSDNLYTLNHYLHTYSKLDEVISEVITGGASSVYNSTERCVDLSVTTGAGDRVMRSTNHRHKHQYGTARVITLASRCTSKAGNTIKRWGYFDDQDGLFFQCKGSDLSLVIRSSMGGSIVDTVFNQSDWNGDIVDGSGGLRNISGLDFDCTKLNTYGIDFNWMNTGSAIFFIEYNGERVVLHNFAHANTNSVPYMRTGSLSISWEIINEEATTEPSTVKVYTALVQNAGEFAPEYESFGFRLTPLGGVDLDTNDEVVLGAFRSAQTFRGKYNSLRGIAEQIDLMASGPVEITVRKNPTVIGTPTWNEASPDESGLEVSLDLEATGGRSLVSSVTKNEKVIDLSPFFGFGKELVIRKPFSGMASDIYIVTATRLTSTNTNIHASVNWREVR